MVERNGHYHFDNEPERRISQVQRLHLELIRLTAFNECDGQQIAADLERYPGLWQAALMANFGHGGELLALRDLNHGINNVDTLLVLTTEEHAPAMEELAWTWNPDEVEWLPDPVSAKALGLSHPGDLQILRCWWQ